MLAEHRTEKILEQGLTAVMVAAKLFGEMTPEEFEEESESARSRLNRTADPWEYKKGELLHLFTMFVAESMLTTQMKAQEEKLDKRRN